jgi:hypothetical protein
MPPFITPVRRLLRGQGHGRFDDSATTSKLALRIADVVSRTWHLGLTAFGGPPVHFQILWRNFVRIEDSQDGSVDTGLAAGGKAAWVDEQTVSSGTMGQIDHDEDCCPMCSWTDLINAVPVSRIILACPGTSRPCIN